MYDTEVEPSKSTDPTSEGDSILDSKVRKTGRKKSKFKSALVLLIPFSIQTQPNQVLKNDANNEKMENALFENMVKKFTKILDEKKKRYHENNLPIS